MKRIFTALLVLFFAYGKQNAHAVDYLYHNTRINKPIGIINPNSIKYRVDPGSLGQLSHEQALKILQLMMGKWEEAAAVQFEFNGTLTEDVTAENFQKYLEMPCENPTNDSSYVSEPLIVIFDSDRSILESLNSNPQTWGLAFTRCVAITNNGPQFFTRTIIVLDGTIYNPDDTANSSRQLRGVIHTTLHELGHILGLSHFAGLYLIFDNSETVMAPISYINPTLLHPDDIASISYLYPKNVNELPNAIEGAITLNSGVGSVWVSVTAREVADPFCETFQTWSLLKCDQNSVCSGSFYLPSLPAGNYFLTFDNVNGQMLNAMVPGEFFNENDATIEDPLAFDTVTVNANQVTTGVNVTLASPGTSGNVLVPVFTLPPDSEIKNVLKAGPYNRCQTDATDYEQLLGIPKPISTTPVPETPPDLETPFSVDSDPIVDPTSSSVPVPVPAPTTVPNNSESDVSASTDSNAGGGGDSGGGGCTLQPTHSSPLNLFALISPMFVLILIRAKKSLPPSKSFSLKTLKR
ncbi:MAG: hypothetical protein A2W61_07180 [Deltaproteobacteria bacterium RIFCSPLOWO2_01_44_7]|nr:MAG: hypothetical protein A2712_07410 [Deltaproteobacteria bacterium RIFCSPHIGHO2_01_FULL_43_49]OGQ15770.1 MAG: hypothetical protein A3D22_06200 [Deltaproteobacteria bacterium RIFCSPHIGHO2_02_FULL_44_53]OGQ28918.1 MAG: hypothetical protein A3D98_01415 [Deltaproteobacteria bacterium RIFCSPHIGHO2_12_FULL_44_21]OGQ32063.1 MAG: hypothetical protein A2979_03145 [Deltaproteobacteria bacterium RIFCSPLOWO2_01_FULL_45_74]OGQ40644.1 MAG: hypothetical protein A2W61_07180 [Deltaproteobacteria bacterium 